VTAGFGYAQYAIAIASGLVLVPLTIHRVGATAYGLWLASGEILGHAGMVELGVLGVLPWMIAEADGKNDRATMRHLVGHGVSVAALVGCAYLALAAVGWKLLPGTLHLTPADRATVFLPLAILVAANAVSYPLRVFQAVLAGLQDVYFNGALSLVNATISALLTAVLLLHGQLLLALALGAAVPSVLGLVAAFVRVAFIAPDLLRGWSRPSLAAVRPLVANGAGVWLSSVGWALVAATNGIVMTYLGHPEWVAIYACTSKLSAVSTQLAWVLPDSGLVGLAHLHGERRETGRVRPVVVMLLRLHFLLAGAAACGLLAFNPAFVSRWVGPAYFGGLPLNGLLAASIVASSIAHGLVTAASVLGNRPRVGAVTLANGVVQAALALVLGRAFGLVGIAWAGLLAGLVTVAPAAIVLLRPSTDLTIARVLREVVGPWCLRIAPLAAVAAVAGWFHQSLGLVASGAIAAAIVAAYGWQMRPWYASLPLGPRTAWWLVRLRLVSPNPIAVPDRSAMGLEQA